ncbi:MAG: type IV pilus twitching motility protein PilT [Candidatus Omnitrophica bacterium]|nr:type IV pilus twitching motility protein PilT [Candidatus Omnitrophota bacterium]
MSTTTPHNLDSIFKTCIENQASDIHLSFNLPVSFRIFGRLRHFGDTPITDEEITEFARQLTNKIQWKELEEKWDTEFAHSLPSGERFRISVFKQRGHHSIVMRRIPSRIMTLEEIGFPPIIKSLLNRNHGLILVTGPTGSGKTTSLASMIDFINQNDDRHIITVEDPIEYVHEHKRSIINQREMDVDTNSFSKAVIDALRQDPDVILVGEMRDLATIEAVLTATETGTLVFATLHTFGDVRTIDRIIDVFPAHQQNQIRLQLSLNLAAVISQQLIPRKDKEGRIAALEIMVINSAIQNLIRKGQTYNIPNEIQMGAQHGMVSLQNQLAEYVRKGIISKDDALFYAIDVEDIARRLGPSS